MSGKYQKYFLEYDPSMWPMERRPVMSRVEDSVAPGANFYLIHWVPTDFAAPLKDMEYGGHPPHIHKYGELLFHIGSNPNDPMDLGAEVEMCMGPELERYTINRTCCIWIPPNFIHSPWRPIKIDRPWIFIEVNQGPYHSEKSYRQLLPRKVREQMDWSMWPDEGYEIPA